MARAVLIRSEMLRRVRSIVAFAASLGMGLGPSARAQTTTAAENVAATGDAVPLRLVGGVLQNPRPQNLNPTGINYSDCISDMVLQFSVALSGFAAADLASMQIWATKTSDCTSTTSRGIGGLLPTCWPLGQGTPADFVATTTTTETFNLRVQDIVGPQNSPSTTFRTQGPAACSTQTTYAAIPMNIWFLPLDSNGNYLGTGYNYPITIDLVGPPAPVGVTESTGDTIFIVNWTPNVDADTSGYDIYVDPIPGSTTLNGTDGAVNQLICPDATVEAVVAPSTVVDGAGDEASVGEEAGSVDATVDAASSSATARAGSGCYNAPIIPMAPAGSTCPTTVFGSGIVVDGGTVSTTELDEAGNVIGTTTTSGSGGISTVPSENLVDINSGFTISSESSGNFTITGLTNQIEYHVAVSAVDGSGNIGPPSVEVCDYPAPVNDFWKNYRDAGGLAGGGFCALEAVGLPVGPTVAFAGAGACVLAVVRRRRRRR